MRGNAFSAGVEPGGLRNSTDIKILICYIFSSLNKPLDKTNVIEAIQESNLANYFELNNAFAELIDQNNLLVDPKTQKITLTESGKMIADQLETTLPLSVRKQALNTTIKFLTNVKLKNENSATIKKDTTGYTITCSIPDGQIDLLSFSLHLPDKLQAELVKENFYNNPEMVYKSILAVLTKDKELAKEIFDDNLN